MIPRALILLFFLLCNIEAFGDQVERKPPLLSHAHISYGRVLLIAAQRGDTLVANLMINGFRANPEHQDESGRTALLHAVRQGHLETAGFLLSQGASLQTRDHQGLNALTTAVYSGRIEMLRLILQSETGAIDYQSRFSALMISLINARDDLMQVLLEAGSINPSTEVSLLTSLFGVAICSGNERIVDLLNRFFREKFTVTEPAASDLKPHRKQDPDGDSGPKRPRADQVGKKQSKRTSEDAGESRSRKRRKTHSAATHSRKAALFLLPLSSLFHHNLKFKSPSP